MQGCFTERRARQALDLVPNEPGRSLFSGLGVSGTLLFLSPCACCSVSGRCEPTEPKSSYIEKDQPLSVSLGLASCPRLDQDPSLPQPAPTCPNQQCSTRRSHRTSVTPGDYDMEVSGGVAAVHGVWMLGWHSSGFP